MWFLENNGKRILKGQPLDNFYPTDIISAMISSCTDNAKEMKIDLINGTEETLSGYIYCILIGMDIHKAFNIFGRPIVSKLINESRGDLYKGEERNKILIDAQKEADEIISDTKLRASRMVEEHEVTKMAYEQASEIIENAKKTSREMRLGTVEYTDQMLSITEDRLKELLVDLQREHQKTESFLNEALKKLAGDREELDSVKR